MFLSIINNATISKIKLLIKVPNTIHIHFAANRNETKFIFFILILKTFHFKSSGAHFRSWQHSWIPNNPKRVKKAIFVNFTCTKIILCMKTCLKNGTSVHETNIHLLTCKYYIKYYPYYTLHVFLDTCSKMVP